VLPRRFAATGPFDQKEAEARKDVLLYTTPALEHDLESPGQSLRNFT